MSIGCLHFAAVPALAAWLGPLGGFSPTQHFCRDVAGFTWESTFWPDHSYRRSYPGAMQAFVEACEVEFASLGQEQRAVLEPFVGRALPEHVSKPPFPGDAAAAARAALREGTSSYKTRAQLPGGPSTASLRRRIEELQGEPLVAWIGELDNEGKDASLVDRIEPAGVADALRHGRVATFDATRLLPSWVFNISVDDLTAMHRAANASAALWTGRGKGCGHVCAQSWLCKALELESAICPEGVDSFCNETERERECDHIVNIRRIPEFVDLQAQVVEPLGLDSWVERTEGQIFWGFNRGVPHWDEQDNIMFALSGITVAWIASSNYTDAVNGRKLPLLPWDTWSEDKMWVSDHVPFYKVLLLPGDALVIPSRSYHFFRSTSDRIGMNSFFEPKFSHAGWPETAPGGHWHRETTERRALRNLWLKALARMWESKRLPMFLQGSIEYL